MVLLALALSALSPQKAPPAGRAKLPAWAYAYELPDVPTVLVNGRLRPATSEGAVLPGFGGGGSSAPPPAKLPPLRLGELVPGFPSALGFALDGRLSRAFVERATHVENPSLPQNASTFTVKQGDEEITYGIDPQNRIQAAIYNTPVARESSEARFAAFRDLFTRRLGVLNFGLRYGDSLLTLTWCRPDESLATLTIVAGDDGTLKVSVLLVRSDAYGDPVPGLTPKRTGDGPLRG